MKFIQHPSKLVLLAFTIFSLFFVSKRIDAIVQGNDTCLCSYDGFGYYMYLPSLFKEGNLDIQKEWAEKLQNEYCGGTVVYQLLPQENGKNIDLYHMGMAVVELPGYLAGDLFAKALGYKQDGFSKPYYIAFVINMFLILILGLVYLRKLLLLFFSENIAALSLLILVSASNLFITFSESFTLPHCALFSLNTLFLYYTIIHYRTGSNRSLYVASLILGLTVFIRPTQALWGIIPFILFYGKYQTRKEFWKKIALFPLAGLIWNIPQIIYWKIIGGKLIMHNLHTEELIFTDPNLWKFLFSYRKGWLLYSPVFFAAIAGILVSYFKDKRLFFALSSFTILNIFVLSSWECWWYAASYSSRVMVDSYATFALGFGFLLVYIQQKKIVQISLFVFLFGVTVLNILQSIQFRKGYLDHSRMSKQHYWYIFGKTDIQNYSGKLLEIDRSDTNWINYAKDLPKNEFQLNEQIVFELKNPINTPFEIYQTIGRIPLLKKVQTDETLFEVDITVITPDSTKSALLRMETVSKYNCYSWDGTEISLGKRQHQKQTIHFKFNLPYIRHKDDEMQMYIFSPDNVQVKILNMRIKGYSLLRK